MQKFTLATKVKAIILLLLTGVGWYLFESSIMLSFRQGYYDLQLVGTDEAYQTFQLFRTVDNNWFAYVVVIGLVLYSKQIYKHIVCKSGKKEKNKES